MQELKKPGKDVHFHNIDATQPGDVERPPSLEVFQDHFAVAKPIGPLPCREGLGDGEAKILDGVGCPVVRG